MFIVFGILADPAVLLRNTPDRPVPSVRVRRAHAQIAGSRGRARDGSMPGGSAASQMRSSCLTVAGGRITRTSGKTKVAEKSAAVRSLAADGS